MQTHDQISAGGPRASNDDPDRRCAGGVSESTIGFATMTAAGAVTGT
ncbi:MAG: hypothetical protein ABL893_20565 [Hyphomicrobium sp.]|nr:hypothetical protein [Hyphomicrobium sp.]